MGVALRNILQVFVRFERNLTTTPSHLVSTQLKTFLAADSFNHYNHTWFLCSHLLSIIFQNLPGSFYLLETHAKT